MKQLKIQIPIGIYEAIKRQASPAGQSVEEWAANLLRISIPLGSDKQIAASQQAKAAMGAAFSQLDKQDAESHPAEAQMLAEEPEAPKVTKSTKDIFCQFLSEAEHPHFAGQSSGTCEHVAQRGRVCFWDRGTMRNCSFSKGFRR